MSCSFCGKPQDAVSVLVKGFHGCICNECVDIAKKLVETKLSELEKED
ncbi:ClpX C4-type zinc finger protein [Listeria monocytogenes]